MTDMIDSLTTEDTLISSGVEDVIEATISDASKALVFDILRNKIYSNKIGAAVRETISNAKDAHISAGKADVPIQIHLPTKDNPFFIVQDWGTGMSPQIIRKVYMDYASSSKKADAKSIGKFGVGANACHCVADSFTITTVVDGIKYWYVNALNGQINQLNKLGEAPTDEENGTIISVPVQLKDLEAFEQEIFYYTKYWSVQPLIVGKWNSVHSHNYSKSLPVYPQSIVKGTDWMIDSTADSICLVGEIPYPVRWENLKLPKTYNSIFSHKLVLEFGGDDVDIPVSREGIEYTDKTKAAFEKRLDKVSSELPNLVQEIIEQKSNLKEAVDFFYKELPDNFMYKCSAFFRGMPIKRVYSVPFTMRRYTKTHSRSQRSTSKDVREIEMISHYQRERPLVVINDLGKKSCFKKDEIFSQYNVDRFYYLCFKEKGSDFELEEDIEDFLRRNTLFQPQFLDAVKISDIYKPVPRKKRQYDKQEKGKIKAYRYNGGYSYSSSVYSVCIKEEISVEAGENTAYFEIVGLQNSESGAEPLLQLSKAQLSPITNVFRELQAANPQLKIYGVTSVNVPKLENWTHVSQLIESWLLNKLTNSTERQTHFSNLSPTEYKDYMFETIRQLTAFENSKEFSRFNYKFDERATVKNLDQFLPADHSVLHFVNKICGLNKAKQQFKNDLNLVKRSMVFSKKVEEEAEAEGEEPIEAILPPLVKEFQNLELKYPLLTTLLSSNVAAHDLSHYIKIADYYVESKENNAAD